MRVAGVICEFDPFHNGHAHLLRALRDVYGAEAIVCVMSGHFTQRGQPAAWDKWTRTEMALAGGADLVLELPTCYACASAERFAFGGVALLAALGVVDILGFGSETGEIAPLQQAADWLDRLGTQEAVEAHLAAGMSYPAAREKAAAGQVPAGVLSRPNNVLGVEYCKAIVRLGHPFVPVTIPRVGAAHGAADTGDGFASASYLRSRSDPAQAAGLVPDATLRLWHASPRPSIDRLGDLLYYRLRTMDQAVLAGFADVTEGLEARMLDAAGRGKDYETLRQTVKTKRYTMTRVDRVLLAALLGIPKSLPAAPPQYIRVLGMTKTGQAVLRACKQTASLPILTKTADADFSGLAAEMFALDVRATDVYAILQGGAYNVGGRDFTTSPVILA